MGCEVVVGGATADELAAVIDLFEQRDGAFSRFRERSELTRINRSPSRVLVVSDAFAAMANVALAAAGATDGLVDPTVGAAIVALGYDRDFDELERDAAPVEAVPAGRFLEVRVRGRILERPVGLQLDLNGVVKGRTVDDALALIGGDGVVSAGGDLATRGARDVGLPDGSAIRLERGGLATSGTLTRSWHRGGQRVHHLIDPTTGLPAESPWTCVTVAGASCLAADVAAKAAFLQGGRGPEWLERRSLPGRFLCADGTVTVTRDWAEQAEDDRLEAA
jgi:thiamine biosynthesis lipoprotein ApbE